MSLRKPAVLAAGMTLLVSFGLWVWTSGIYYRTLPTPGCSVRLPFVGLGACADDEGIHFLAMKQRAGQFPAIHFGRGFTGYHHGYVVNMLGLVMAVLPTEHNGGDYSVSPHAALVLPYWLLIVGAVCVLVVRTPVFTWIAPYCRLSKLSGGVAGFVCVVFAMLNFVPSTWGPGAVQPQTISEWATLTLQPAVAYSDIMLVYGYPFPCYRRGIINGESVSLFYGARAGWEPHRAMENVCVAGFAVFCAVLVTQRLRKLFGTQEYSTPPNKKMHRSCRPGRN